MSTTLKPEIKPVEAMPVSEAVRRKKQDPVFGSEELPPFLAATYLTHFGKTVFILELKCPCPWKSTGSKGQIAIYLLTTDTSLSLYNIVSSNVRLFKN